jgi:nitroimidazol reductase NimA-like FMN-containing flavoprotein (pyridoxamine 5'-phosphate oxidase superfamily)
MERTDIDVNGLEVLSRAESVALLESEEVGRLVYTRRALPAVTPVNYAVRRGAVLIWTASLSTLIPAVRGAVVAFEADRLDRAARCGWSVVVTGTAQLVSDSPERDLARLDGPVPWVQGARDHLIRIPLTMVTGRWLGLPRGAARPAAVAPPAACGPDDPRLPSRPVRANGSVAP